MRNHSLSGNIASLLRRCKELESAMRRVGVPAFLACMPMALLALQYALMLREKNASIARISGKIDGWTATVRELSGHELGRSEFIDLDRKMRGDIEGACDSMRALRDLCVEICGMFRAVGYESRVLQRSCDRFDAAVNEACRRSQNLITAVDEHDSRALAIRQQEHAIKQAGVASEAAHAARVAAGIDA